MSERRGRSARAAGMAENVAAAVRRRQRDRGPRVVVYDGAGKPRVVAPAAPGYDALLDTAERMVAVAAETSDERRGDDRRARGDGG